MVNQLVTDELSLERLFHLFRIKTEQISSKYRVEGCSSCHERYLCRYLGCVILINLSVMSACRFQFHINNKGANIYIWENLISVLINLCTNTRTFETAHKNMSTKNAAITFTIQTRHTLMLFYRLKIWGK